MTSPAVSEVRLPPPPPPEWTISPEPDPEVVARLALELSLPEPLCAVLAVRGVRDPDAAKVFLRPRLDHLHPPERMRDLERAADRILEAVVRGETVLVHGDYDVDGVCAAALLTLWIRRLGGSAVPFVPHRVRDGYDLGPAGLEATRQAGASLLVTCDSGILAHDAVSEASRQGIDVIVTDHHLPGAMLPPALAVVNPNRSDCEYPDRSLCGAGVIFKLCQELALRRQIPPEELWRHLDLVTLATIADLVPLTGENRILVRFGLRYLTRTSKPGLRALLEVSGISPGAEIEAGKVGFVVAPRINAVGRMGDAAIALQLLLTEDPREAGELARRVDQENARRQEEDRATLDEAVALLAPDFDETRDFGVVLAGEGWHPGIIGIVASRVVERIHRPVVVVAMDGDQGRGSARSIPGVHMLRALERCESHLLRFGGHRQAAGMELAREALIPFRKAFNREIEAQLDGHLPRPVRGGEVRLPLPDVTEELHRLLGYLGPFGMGNPRPVFWARGLRLEGRPRVVGRGHLKLELREGRGRLGAIGFGLADRVSPASLDGGSVDALFHLRENEYRGTRSLQARLLDLRPADSAGA